MGDTDQGAPRVLGDLGADEGRGVVRISDRYDTDVDDLWSALTDPDRLARWYGVVDGDLREGGAYRAYVATSQVETRGRVVTCRPPARLLVTARETEESHAGGPGVPPFDAEIELTLTPAGERTDLVLVVRGMPLDKIPFYGVGWQLHAENLAAHVLGRELPAAENRWGALLPAYQELASTLS